MINKKTVTSGKRKTSIARCMITEGNGNITINKRDYRNLHEFDRLKIEEPIRIAQEVLGKINFDASIDVAGGGVKSQVEAARLSLARGIIKFSKSKQLEKVYTEYDRNLLVADTRRKESYKPGDSKARAKRQSSKR